MSGGLTGGGLTVGEPEPRPLDWAALGLGVLLGVTGTFIVGSQNGAEVGRSIEAATRSCVDQVEARTLEDLGTCYEMTAETTSRVEAQRVALERLASRCVLSVPEGDRLRVTRERNPSRFAPPPPPPPSIAAPKSATLDVLDWSSPDFFAPGDMDGRPE